MARQQTAPTRRQPRGERTKSAILRCAVDLASVEGLEGLSIGRLAEKLNMSKSGLFAHFGSKQELQLETIEAARQIFIEEIIRPALAQPEGMLQLWALCDGWLSHVEREVFAGGCFFTAAAFEFDSRKGPIRNRIAEIMKIWIAKLQVAVEVAQKAGQLDPKVDAAQLAFEMNSLAMGAHWANQLLDKKNAFTETRTTILRKLRSLATKKCPPLPRLTTR
ncbi:MAG TPA: TetR/AcrR family transcriptional regulator [Terriglobales bacterium]|nr:TetR/AcrR family transcriptional regulator [Terriglobales bacterium]